MRPPVAALVGLTDRPAGAAAAALWLALLGTLAHSLATARAALQVLTLLSVTWR